MPPHLRGNHAGCAASHKGVKHNTAFGTTGEKTGLNQLRRVGCVVTALEGNSVDLPDIALVAERIDVTILDLAMLTGAVDGLRLRLTALRVLLCDNSLNTGNILTNLFDSCRVIQLIGCILESQVEKFLLCSY